MYCDFCSFVSRNEDERAEYVRSLCREIAERGTKDYIVDTVYFGGGTPSLLSVAQMDEILSTVRENFVLAENVEITLECNPMTHLEDGLQYFADIRRLGVNRLSMGVQSANDNELKLIGRRHTFAEAKNTFWMARESGFENISLDLMFGIPSQTMESLKKSVSELVALYPEHISIYSLQLEEGTPLYKMQDKYCFADDDTVADMYESVVALMRENGYSHYEISNYARDDRESRHNNKYWQLDEYIGLGLAAHSDFDGKRIENTSKMQDYLDGAWMLSSKEVSEKEREIEFLMLGLRTKKGISKNTFFERFGFSFDEKYGKKVEQIKKMGYLEQIDDRVALTEQGFEISNSILAELLDFDY